MGDIERLECPEHGDRLLPGVVYGKRQCSLCGRRVGDGLVVVRYVPEGRLEGAVEDLREVLGMIDAADRGDWDQTIPTLGQYARTRLSEIGGR